MTQEIKLASGSRLTLWDPAPERLGFVDMLHHLGLQAARAGATLRPFWMTQRAAMLSGLAELAAKELWDGWRVDRSPHATLVHQAALYGFLLRDGAALLSDVMVNHPDWTAARLAYFRARIERYGLTWPPPGPVFTLVEHCDTVIEALIDRDLGTGAVDHGDFPIELRTPDRERCERIYVRRFVALRNPAPDYAPLWAADRDGAESWLAHHPAADYDVWGVPSAGGVTLPLHRQDVERLAEWIGDNLLRPRRKEAAQ